MKILITVLLLFPLYTQAQVFDNFTDGNFSASPVWTGNSGAFEVNSSHQLHLNTQGAAVSYLSTAYSYQSKNIEWGCWIKLSFNTSVNNNARIYLSANKSDLSTTLNGYFIQVGETNDSIALCKQDGLNSKTLIKSKYAYTGNSVNTLRVKVTRDSTGLWKLFSDAVGGYNFLEEGNYIDTTYALLTGYTGIFCKYTSSNSAKFYFDDFYVGQATPPSDSPTDTVNTESIKTNDIIINEVLFNPKDDGVDFVEIYNRSNKILNLQNLYLATLNSSQEITSAKAISSKREVIYPKAFYVLSSDSAEVKHQYTTMFSSKFINLSSMPAYNNDAGTVVLINDSNVIIDQFSYNEDMQFPLLNSVEGVSLERISYESNTNDPNNWHSAAESVGFATPGYQNSQYFLSSTLDNPISVNPEIFSPDNDGYNDVTTINCKTDAASYIANVSILNSTGKLIRKLISNELIGVESSFIWDGLTDNKQKADVGIYIIIVELFNKEGQTKKYKTTCVVGSKDLVTTIATRSITFHNTTT